MVNQVSVSEARALQLSGSTYVDVRSTPEFAHGHPSGAVNVPLLEPDEDTGQMLPNPDFLRVLQAIFNPDTPLLIGCQVSGRSVRAAQVLEAIGFRNLSVVRGGFQGSRDPIGRPVDPGWAESGLPVATGTGGATGYHDLLARADHAR